MSKKVANRKKTLTVDKRLQAIELIALNPGIKNVEICEKLKINKNTIGAWRKNAKFNELCYNRFMDVSSSELIEVVMAMLRESKTGNVRAAELILKHYGKLQDTLTIRLESPFMQHMKAKELEFEDAELDEMDAMDIGNSIDLISSELDKELPPRNINANKPGKIQEEKNKIYKEVKHQRKNISQNERYALRKRARAVGMELMPAGKPSKTQKADWIIELEKLEVEKGVKVQ